MRRLKKKSYYRRFDHIVPEDPDDLNIHRMHKASEDEDLIPTKEEEDMEDEDD